MLRVSVAGVLVLAFTTPAWAGTSDDYNRERFAQWSSIGISCDLSPDNTYTQSLCNWAKRKARIVAAAVRVPSQVLPSDGFDRAVALGRLPTTLPLIIDVQAAGAPPNAIKVRLAAEVYGTWSDSKRTGVIGTVNLWEKTVVGGGFGPELVTNIQQAIEANLNEFFADFAVGYSQAN